MAERASSFVVALNGGLGQVEILAQHFKVSGLDLVSGEPDFSRHALRERPTEQTHGRLGSLATLASPVISTKLACINARHIRVVDSRAVDGRMRAVNDPRYDTAMPKSAGRGWQYHVGLSGLMLVILVILLLTGNLKQAPPLIAPGLDFNTSQPATRR